MISYNESINDYKILLKKGIWNAFQALQRKKLDQLTIHLLLQTIHSYQLANNPFRTMNLVEPSLNEHPFSTNKSCRKPPSRRQLSSTTKSYHIESSIEQPVVFPSSEWKYKYVRHHSLMIVNDRN